MKAIRAFQVLVLVLAAAMATSLAACAAPTAMPPGGTPTTAPTDAVSAATSARYRVGEVRNYKGMNLDPAIGPSDNSIKGVQHVDIATYRLTVDGQVGAPVALTYADVTALDAYERLITLHCVTGWQATILWKGVLLDDVIALAGGPKDKAVTVVFECADGYTTSMPLATIRGKQLILAYRANGLDLPAELGYPFIVVAEDKFGYKWARWVTKITLSDDPNYLGYWESRGYDNGAGIG